MIIDLGWMPSDEGRNKGPRDASYTQMAPTRKVASTSVTTFISIKSHIIPEVLFRIGWHIYLLCFVSS